MTCYRLHFYFGRSDKILLFFFIGKQKEQAHEVRPFNHSPLVINKYFESLLVFGLKDKTILFSYWNSLFTHLSITTPRASASISLMNSFIFLLAPSCSAAYQIVSNSVSRFIEPCTNSFSMKDLKKASKPAHCGIVMRVWSILLCWSVIIFLV